MKRVEDYFFQEEENDKIIQKALREVDMDCVINLCVYLDEKAELIYRNLSQRVNEQVQSEVKERGTSIPGVKQKSSYLLFQKKLLKFEKKQSFLKNEDESTLHRLDFSGLEEIKESFYYLYKLNKSGDVETMEHLIGDIESPSLRRQMETVLFAEDPLSGEAVIDRMASRLREELDKRQSLIKEGLLSLLAEEPEEVFMEKIYD